MSRPGRFGNPFRVGDRAPDGIEIVDRADAVERFRIWVNADDDEYRERRVVILERVHELRGHDLACWCPLDGPCHADVLLDLANAEDGRHRRGR